jgi:hypothetical protein
MRWADMDDEEMEGIEEDVEMVAVEPSRQRAHLVRCARVFVLNMDNFEEAHAVMTNQFDTVGTIKRGIEERWNIPAEFQVLVFRTLKLDNDALVLSKVNIHAETLLHVKDSRTMDILIGTMSGRCEPLSVVPSLTTETLKKRIMSLKGLANLLPVQQNLFYGGRLMMDREVLSRYRIETAAWCSSAW